MATDRKRRVPKGKLAYADGSVPWSTDGELRAYERLPGEPDKAWDAFVMYRDMGAGQRSLKSLSEQDGRSRDLFERWSSNWWWSDRVAAWDRHLDSEKQGAARQEVREMASYHARLSRQMLNKVAQRVLGDEAAGIAPLDPNTMSARDCAAILREAAMLERASRGQPTEIVADAGPDTIDSARIVLGDPELALAVSNLDARIRERARGAPPGVL